MYKKYLYVVAALITLAFTSPAQAKDYKHGNKHHKQYQERDDDDYDNERHQHRYYQRHEERRVYYVDVRDDDHHHHHHPRYITPYLLDHFVISLNFR